MRKSYYMAVTVGLVLLLCIVVFVKHEGFWVSEQKMTPKQLIESKGYEIVSEEGFVRSYLLTREKLLKFPYVQHWSVQSVDVEKYIGKEIEIHRFIVKNHILDNAKDNKKRQTVVCVLAVDGRAFGGSSLPDWDEVYRGGVWSLEGKTLEEVTGIDFLEWSDKWEKRFGQP